MSRRWNYKDGPLADSNEEFDEIWRKISQLSVVSTRTISATIDAAETEIRHGLGKKPTSVVAIPRADARVWQTRNATETTIYLAANTPVECDIRVE